MNPDPTWQDWMLSATSGAAGALIGLIGLFVVYNWTRRHDRERDQADREATRRQAWEERADELVGAAVQASHKINAVKPDKAELCERLANILAQLAAHAVREEPDVSRWALELSMTFTEFVDADLDVRAVPWEAGRLMSILMMWRGGNLPTEAFADLYEAKRKENENAAKARKARAVPLPEDDPAKFVDALREELVRSPSKKRYLQSLIDLVEDTDTQ